MGKLLTPGLELWGGIECSINRVNDDYFDQLEYSGHYERECDLDLFAGLGLTKMRYPILWEKHQPEDNSAIDWTYTESRLNKLRASQIDVIAGLVHHGSGPAYVQMDQDSFVDGLAAYAVKVAEKFPWINFYTPVNEPLTTARFCGLYGIWHPHKNTDSSFCRILVNECKATVLAMQGIRKINPNAQLVQTEDLGKVHSTPLLGYQAEFENNRRWLTFDLLNGKVDDAHPLWAYLLKSGIGEDDLTFFLDNKCEPAVLGINHYLTSERYIDETLNDFPPHTHGGNTLHRYADVEAVRVGHVCPDGPYNLLKQAWERYHQPIAVTEVHLYCSREEQMRWLSYVHRSASRLRSEGADIRAITTWAMLGSFGWNSLLTRANGDYEPGIFDLKENMVRPTALSAMIKAYANNESFNHPLLNTKGWWQRECRVEYGIEQFFKPTSSEQRCPHLLIVGKTGTPLQTLEDICQLRGIAYQVLGQSEMDCTDTVAVEKVLAELKPWAIINTADLGTVDDRNAESGSCYEVNTDGALNLASVCAKHNVKLLAFSTDVVFKRKTVSSHSGHQQNLSVNTYRQGKILAEKRLLKHNPNALIVRTPVFFGPWDKHNFTTVTLDRSETIDNNGVFQKVFISATHVQDIVNTSLDLMIDDEKGICILNNDGSVSTNKLHITAAGKSEPDISRTLPNPIHDIDLESKRRSLNQLRSAS